MSATTVRLLQAAREIAGSNKALASRLGISDSLLARYMADVRELPDTLLLRAVDIILENRDTPSAALPSATSPTERAAAPDGDGRLSG